MSRYKVLYADYSWEDVHFEREVLAKIGAELIEGRGGTLETPPEDELVRLVRDVDGIILSLSKVTAKVIEASKRCRVISRLGIGIDNVAVEAATKRGIVVTNIPDYCVDEVAEHALAAMLALARKLFVFDRTIKAGAWDLQVGFPIRRIAGQTLGIIGLGKIGRSLARRALGLGLKLLAYDPYVSAEECSQHGATKVELEVLLKDSDFVSIHTPLTEETSGMIGERELKQMKPTAFLINTARGPIVDDLAVARALEERWIQGAALDVLPQEPPAKDHPLRQLDNVILSPHASFYSSESLQECRARGVQAVVDVLAGKRPRNPVNPQVFEARS